MNCPINQPLYDGVSHSKQRRDAVATAMANISLLMERVYREIEDAPDETIEGIKYEWNKFKRCQKFIDARGSREQDKAH